MAERTLSATRLGVGNVRGRLRVLALASLTGVVAGMGSFMTIKHTYIPWGVSPTWAYVIICLAGAYTHFLAKDLSESITLALLAFVVGIAVHVGSWIAPLWTIPYPPIARGVLLPQMLGRALAGNILTYVVTFFGSYFGAVMVSGYLEA
jgi:hypothetical protein